MKENKKKEASKTAVIYLRIPLSMKEKLAKRKTEEGLDVSDLLRKVLELFFYWWEEIEKEKKREVSFIELLNELAVRLKTKKKKEKCQGDLTET